MLEIFARFLRIETYIRIVLLISRNENLLFGLMRPSRSMLLVLRSSPGIRKVLFNCRSMNCQQLTCVQIGQVNHIRIIIHHHHRQVSIEAQRSRLLQADRLNPLAGLGVEDVDVRFRVDQQVTITISWNGSRMMLKYDRRFPLLNSLICVGTAGYMISRSLDLRPWIST